MLRYSTSSYCVRDSDPLGWRLAKRGSILTALQAVRKSRPERVKI